MGEVHLDISSGGGVGGEVVDKETEKLDTAAFCGGGFFGSLIGNLSFFLSCFFFASVSPYECLCLPL